MKTNRQLELALNYVQFTGKNIFLTGKAGTGKTTFLHNLRDVSSKRMVIVAPTGVAAINAGGVTIHSFFQLPFGPLVGTERIDAEQKRFRKEKINIIRSLDLLVIDEISMVRADLLDAIDYLLRRYRTRGKPFGGVQLLMIGDLQQLAPVVTDNERELLDGHYDSPYFFSSHALRETSFVGIELTHVFRQQDDRFISLLNCVRENRLEQATLDALNERYIPDFIADDKDGYIILCTHNAQAQRINENKLAALSGVKHLFKATIDGSFPEYSYPTDSELTLKIDAQVMFVKNDSSAEKRFFNGKIGKITAIDDNAIHVLCPNEDEEIVVTPLKWENVRYSLDPASREISEVVDGTFTQYPLKLAWAITIHKSQGLTFERAVIDAQDSFAHGQVYVALSRCKTLEGMVLRTPIRRNCIISDQTVGSFTQAVERNQPDETQFQTARIDYQQEMLFELFDFKLLRSRIAYVVKIIDDNEGSIPAITHDVFKMMSHPVQQHIVEVANKFYGQISHLLSQQPDISQHTVLQDRICRASNYFSEKIQTLILDAISEADLDVDNKAVKKQLKDAVRRLEDDVCIKYECLCACHDGFRLENYLHAKAVAAIDATKDITALQDIKKTDIKTEYRRAHPRMQTDEHGASTLADNYIAHPELFSRLRAWRMEKSTEMNVPPYVIFSQKALYEMVNHLPTNNKSLLEINGIGKKKVEQFGADILAIIAEYRATQSSNDHGAFPSV